MSSDEQKSFSGLTLEQQSLLMLRLRRKAIEGNGKESKYQPLLPVARDELLPLSFAQERLWFLDQLEPGHSAYSTRRVMRLTGLLDVAALEKTFNEIIRRHEALRTNFPLVDGRPLQNIEAHRGLSIPVVDLSHLPEGECETEAERLAGEEGQRGFDLSRGPLLRIKLFRLERENHLLVLTIHHIISDGWSMGVLMREMTALYNAYCRRTEPALPELSIQYADYAHWQRQWLQGEVLDQQLSYWKQQLEGAPEVLSLPNDRPRSPIHHARGKRHNLKLTQTLTNQLRELSRREDVTLFMTMLAAFQTLLYRYTGQTDIVVGTPIANRTRAEIEPLIGFFINTLVIRTKLSGNQNFHDLLQLIKELALGAYAHQDLPFEKLVQELKPERTLDHTPIFQVLFQLQNATADHLEMTGVKQQILRSPGEAVKFDLEFHMLERNDGIGGVIVYNADLFHADTIQRLASHFEKLLESIVNNPHEEIASLSLLTAEEQQLLSRWSNAHTISPPHQCVHELFETHAAETPDAVALVHQAEQLSYAELNTRANRLAHHLLSLGVGPETLVGILMERSIEMVVSLLAILKAGGAYVPLDPAYPAERLSFMIEDARVRVLLTQTGLRERIPAGSATVLCPDSLKQELAGQSGTNPAARVCAENLAYVIYTSGSTGMPKGVAIPHRAVVRLVNESNYASFSPEQVFLQYAPISFDASTFELWGPLLNGARLVVMPPEMQSLAELAEAISRYQVTTLWLTAGLFHLMVEQHLDALAGLEQLLAGGDVLSVEDVERARRGLSKCQVINGYGPTENTTFSCCYQVGREQEVQGSVPIGRAVSNTRVYVLDEQMRLVPIGVKGELYLSGEGLARGYIGGAELTAERFVPDPYTSGSSGGERLYRTGDEVRWRESGELEFIGRVDQQVKIRGYRIELGEIEAVLSRHEGVSECLVVAREELEGEKQLVAYVVAEEGAKLSSSEWRSYLRERLPEYMIPAAFMVLEQLPLTANGKVDRKALPEPDRTQSSQVFTEPRTAVEELLCGIWCTLLKREKTGVYDNFFDLGGHSLLATRLVSRLREAFAVELPLRSVFEEQTVAAQAELIEAMRRDDSVAVGPPLIAVERTAGMVLSFAQERLWFMHQLEPDSAAYNIRRVVRLEGTLHLRALEQSLSEIVRRHEVLRTSFKVESTRPVQVITPAESIQLPLTDLSDLLEADRETEVRRLAGEAAMRPFDLSHGPLLRIGLVRLHETEHVLILTMHHIVSDGWSMSVFVRELAALYEAYAQDREPALPELSIQYADYAHWQRQWLQGEVLDQQLSYWKQQLEGAPEVLNLPTDRPRPALQSYDGAVETFLLPQSAAAALRELSRREDVTLFMTMLAAFQALLYRYTGQTDVVVGTPIANRTRAEVEPLIGFFINTLVMRTRLSGVESFTNLLKRVREVCLGAYAHQDMPFEKLVDELRPERSSSFSPLFQVMFVMQNAPADALELAGLNIRPQRVDGEPAKFDLTMLVRERADGLKLTLRYNTKLFDASTIKRMGSHFRNLLEGIVAQPECRPFELPLMSETEQQQLSTWNDTKVTYPQNACIHELFAAQAARIPHAIALVFEDRRLTYRELDQRTNQLAHYLQAFGVGPETLVGVCMERSVDLVVALLGVLKAGGAYLPLDPTYPQKRLALMVEDAGVQLALTQKDLTECLPVDQLRLICLDSDWPAIAEQSRESVKSGVGENNLAYVIYTSGSTGAPKGAMNIHRGLFNRLLWMQQAFELSSSDRVLQKTPYTFDVSVWEFFWPLMVGATLVVSQPRGHQDARYLVDLINAEQITTLHFVPSMLQVFLAERGVAECRSLKRVICSGEALSYELQKLFFSVLRSTELHNLYGPTEASIDVTSWECRRESELGIVPIGRPIANTEIHIVHDEMQPVPVGIRGQLLIGGDGLARGYLGRAELTAERFVPDALSGRAGARLYQTGDVARYLGDGAIEYVGRSDEQVKVRGYRIELGEVEHALEQQDEIKQAVVVARGQEVGEKQLVAYVVNSGAELSIKELRVRLRERLPEYMVPSLFVELEQLPLTANGKVDRRRLPEPEQQRSDSEPGFVAPRNELERLVARMWREVLGVEQISVYDNFFDLGGDSIRGAVFINKLQDALGEVVHVVALFDAPTIDDLALYLRRHYQNIGSRFPDLDLAPQNPSARRISVAQLAQIRESIQPLPPARERRTQTTKNPRAVFILAPFRSGSTLLRVMLGGHPGLFAPPELQLLNCNSLQERSRVFSGRDGFWLEGTVRALMEIHSCTAEQAQTLMQEAEERDLSTADFYRELQAAISPRMLVDKTPSYALDLEVLRRAEEYFEEPLYVHLLRHPCGMIRSFEEAKLEQIFRYGEGFSSRELAELIWVVSHENTLEFLGGVERGRQQEVRFEELVREPERVMRELCEFLGVQAEAEMLEVRGGGRMTDGIHGLSRMLGDIKFERHKRIDAAVADRWKQEWEAEDELGEVTCRLAQSLGYEGLPSSATDESLFNTKILTPIKPLAAIEGKGVPLSFAQQRLWFIEQLEPGLPTYNIPAALSLSGPLQLEALRQSLRTLVTRQQSLRSYFALADAVPVQLIAPVPAEFELPVKDLTELPAAERETHVRAAARAEAQRPFALEQGPLLRVQLLRLAEEEHVLLVTMHHIISDGWSLGIFFGELSRLYEATVKGEEARLDELRVQYADYAVWQRGWLKGEVLEEELSYWREQLKGAPSVLELPLDRPRPAVQGYRGAVESFSLSAELTQALKRLSRDEGATLFMTLLACFQLLLWRYSGQAEVVVGTPVANRTRAEIEGLIGFFVNTLVLRVKVEGDWSFRQLLKRVREVCVGAYAHQEVPFERVVEELQPQRSLSLSPLFQVSFALQNAPRERLNFAGLNTRPQRVSSGTVKGDLELYLMDKEGSITGSLVYSTDLFDKPTIARLARHYQNVLSRVVANAEQAISLVELLSAVDREQLLVEWNQTVVQYPQESCLHQLFEAQAERTPDTTAAVFEDEEWSYAELNSCANQLAHYLKGLGVGPEVCVGILLDPSLEAVTAMLATLKAGGYYLPLDRAYPAERLAFMLEDSGARLLLTKNPIERLPETAVPTIYLDAEAESIARCDIENPEANISPENLAYITYTSGSTGIPKGVLITHGSLVNHSLSVARAYELQASDRVLQFASLSFDVSAEELYPTWLSGATVVFCDSDVKASIREFVEFLGAKQVTVANVPTSYWQEWTTRLSSLEKPVPESLRLAIVGSERVPVEMWAEWQRVVGRKVVLCNAYGLTEATITNTIFHPSVEESGDNATAARPLKSLSGSVPIGRPIANTEIYLLDEQLQPLPAGVTGEMYISGAGLARGYHNNSDLTASRFIPHPFRSGARLYRTGDLLRYLADGTLEYVGRRDEQVKVRGHRIELGEIEAILRRHERVCESVLTVDESVAGGRLVAYIVGAAGKAPGGRELRAYLKERLPEYMIPAVFVAVAELPLLPNGKLDRKALPAVDQLKPELEDCYIAPRTPIEELLAAVWCQLLDVPRVGVNDNFFELGGSSLLAMQVIARIQDTLQIKFPLRRIFEEPTVEGLAQALLQANNDERPRLERTAQLLLSLAQLSDAEVESGLEGWPQQAAEGPSSPVL